MTVGYFITKAHLNTYADDRQLYYSGNNHSTLRTQLNNELYIAVDWFKHNGLMASPNKFQLMVLGDRDGIEITRCDDIDLLGVNLYSKFNFDKQVTILCGRVNVQLKVLKRSRTLTIN